MTQSLHIRKLVTLDFFSSFTDYPQSNQLLLRSSCHRNCTSFISLTTSEALNDDEVGWEKINGVTDTHWYIFCPPRHRSPTKVMNDIRIPVHFIWQRQCIIIISHKYRRYICWQLGWVWSVAALENDVTDPVDVSCDVSVYGGETWASTADPPWGHPTYVPSGADQRAPPVTLYGQHTGDPLC